MVYVKCTPHTCDLCAKASIKVLPADVIKIVTESYNWFAHSVKRQVEYKEILDLFSNIDPPKKLQVEKNISSCQDKCCESNGRK